jgi:hypothetical protein
MMLAHRHCCASDGSGAGEMSNHQILMHFRPSLAALRTAALADLWSCQHAVLLKCFCDLCDGFIASHPLGGIVAGRGGIDP